MTPDVRIDRELVGDGDVLPLLISERLEWTCAPSSSEELRESLEEGPRAVLALEEAWRPIFDGGIVQLLYDFGHLVDEAVRAASVVGAPEYEELFGEVVELLPVEGLPPDRMERSDRVEDLLDDDEFDARLEALEERYWELDDEVGSPVDCALRFVWEHPEQFFLTELEAAEDRNAFVTRLVARVGPLERVSDDELATAEAELGRPLPGLLRVLYRDVGAGGWGPEDGLLPPLGEHGLMAAWRRARREFRGPDRGDVWPDTLLPIVRAAGGETICADASEPRLTLARLPASGPRAWAMGTPGLSNEASSLRGWLEAWLRAPD
jgi:Domain of unknown function (DUF4375)/SMI1 / KNR4 family (SUKH-1)